MRSSRLMGESDLYWIMDGRAWRITADGLQAMPAGAFTRQEIPESLDLLDHRTTVWKAQGSDTLILGYPVGSSGMYVARTVPLASLWESLPALPTSMLFSVLIILALGMLLAFLLRRVIARPVRALQEQLERIGGGGFHPQPCHRVEQRDGRYRPGHQPAVPQRLGADGAAAGG